MLVREAVNMPFKDTAWYSEDQKINIGGDLDVSKQLDEIKKNPYTPLIYLYVKKIEEMLPYNSGHEWSKLYTFELRGELIEDINGIHHIKR
jgi:hypothetical protein